MVFGEDASRSRTGLAPHVLSVLRNSAITLLRGLIVSNLTAALREHALTRPLLLRRLRIRQKAGDVVSSGRHSRNGVQSDNLTQ